jgi:acetyl/propionyl-CoA carboxylase alpha subunit
MGSKIAAKETAKKYNVPLVPGTETAVLTSDEAQKIAKEIEFPILIKASAGGGGKGMRAVYNAEELVEQYEMAKSEAKNSFGDDAVMIERYVTAPRHIEIQVLCDNHGNGVYLFERECSIQRRHQKLVEEAPSACLTPAIRKEMGECAVRLALSSNYSGAGTVEFLVDEKLNFYFLEMNTRLQVEHPVSEIICGLDLVKEQIKVAMDLPLSFKQDDLKINGHSIELRVCAEDPMNNFLPDIGKLIRYEKPNGTGVRVDDAYEQGMDIPIYYDPMIAKLIVHGATREEAIDRLCRAIDEYKITGIQTTLQFGKWVVQHPEFKNGNITTNFIAQYFKPEYLKTEDANEANIAALVAAYYFDNNSATKTAAPTMASTTEKNEWRNRREMRS